MFEDFANSFSGFDVNKINGLAMEWDPSPVLLALEQMGGPQAGPAMPGMPNPEGLPVTGEQPGVPNVDWGKAPNKPNPSLADIMFGGVSDQTKMPPLTPQQMMALNAMAPKGSRQEGQKAPPPITPGGSRSAISFTPVGPAAGNPSRGIPSLAEILSGRRA